MKIRKAFKFRLCPAQEDVVLLKQHGGNTRFLYNLLLERHNQYYKQTGKTLSKKAMILSLPKIKKEYDFLQESFSQSLQQVAKHLDTAFVRFFKGISKFPQEKTKHYRNDSFTCPQKWRISEKYVFIPKVGEVKWIKHRNIEGKPKSITISQDGEHWYCSVLCEVEIENKPIKTDNIIGIDLGLHDFVVLSDGTKISNPKHLKKKEKQLRRAQRKLSRRKLGSKNRAKQRAKVCAIHCKVRNTRKDFLHQLSSKLIKEYDGFALENLNIKGMLKNHCLAKSISDVGWGEFARQLEYKSLWYSKAFVKVDMFFPSSKRCSECGSINQALTLSDREWVCTICGTIHDRDINASTNIRDEGIRILNIGISNTVGHTEIYACGEKSSGLDCKSSETIFDEARINSFRTTSICSS